MAIEKNSFKVSRVVDSEFSPRSGETTSSDEEEVRRQNSGLESDEDDEFDDADSGAGSDDFDLLELGETGAEFCQIGNQTCSIPLELYDLPGLEDILSVDVWNECLSEEERFELSKYLPDMDQETFVLTLTELFTGCSLHCGSPMKKLFDMLKGGLCEPRVALYREGLNFFQKRRHYHLLRKHQNDMVNNLCQIRDAWLTCRGYSIQERLRVLNIMRSQKSLMHEKMENSEPDLSDEESGEGLWGRKIKDRKVAQKMGHYPSHGASAGLEFHPRRQPVVLEPEKFGKQNPKGILKFSGSKTPSKDLAVHSSSVYHALDMNHGLNGSATSLPRQNKSVGYDSGSMLRMRDHMRNGENDEEMTYGRSVKRDRLKNKSGVLRVGNRLDLRQGNELDTENLMGLSSNADIHGYSRNANQSSEMKMFTAKPSSGGGSYDFSRKAKYPENAQHFVGGDQMKSRPRGSQLPRKGNLVGSSDLNELFCNNKTPGNEFSMESPFKYEDWNLRSKKGKKRRQSPDLSYMAYRSSSPQVNDRFLSSDRTNSLQEKARGTFVQNGGQDTMALRGSRMLLRNEETESDSSEQSNDDGGDNPLLQSRFPYLMGTVDGSHMTSLKSHLDPKKSKYIRKDVKEHAIKESKKKGSFGEQGHMPHVENYLSKAKKKSKVCNGSLLHNAAGKIMEESYPYGSDKLNDGDDDRSEAYSMGQNGREFVEGLDMPLLNSYNRERKKKGRTGLDHSILSSKYLHDYVGDVEDGSLGKRLPVDDNGVGQSRSGRKGKKREACKGDQNERSVAPLLGCNSATKKRKAKDDTADLDGRDEGFNLLSNFLPHTDGSTSLKRKSKKKIEAETISLAMENSEPRVTDMGAADMELETKPQKKPFILITPTVHTGFSFSIMHLLSAVRMAMISKVGEVSLEVGKPREENNIVQEGGVSCVLSNEKVASNCEHADQRNMPSLTVQEIVDCVRSNPGDPCILETQEPLQDLVRGVLKIFSSKTAPLGAKGWKVLAVFEKSTKSWSWSGPVSHNSSDHDTFEKVASPEAWGLPHKMLVKLVDSFANWLKCGQETLQQMGSLPAPPLALMQVNLDEKERFRDLRAQKSLNTITPSSEEVRGYFRKEEVLRYSIPDRAFSYTAADGKKSIVAPLRRCGGKPTSKAREHFMLKPDRPPHVTILCLVRDAAARLPGSIGTRADVCTLIRDSQYVVEDVSDAQVNQVVSGALDRLHYERDPCVQFDGERKLWVYLHREREEEDFEDDGTSSTKKWKRPKKDAVDQSDQGTATVADHGTEDQQSGHDLCSDLNVDPSSIDDDDKGMELIPNTNLNAEDNVDVRHASEQGNICDGPDGNSMVLDALGVNSTEENKLLCQENSTNEDFDDESSGREGLAGL